MIITINDIIINNLRLKFNMIQGIIKRNRQALLSTYQALANSAHLSSKQSSLIAAAPRRFFAAAEEQGSKEESKAEEKKPTEKELADGRDEWGFKYDDECFKFEKEWKMIADKVESEYVNLWRC